MYGLSTVPLDKCPGVRPIGISEAPRRIIGKAVMMVIGDDVRNSVSSLQLSAGHPAGCEAAIHAMKELFCDDESEGVLLVDADNAFNRLNRKVALWNVRVLCSALGVTVINTSWTCTICLLEEREFYQLRARHRAIRLP